MLGFTFLICFFYANTLFNTLSKPLLKSLVQGKMIATSVTAPLTAPLKLSFLTALMLCVPYVCFQIWSFVAPALYSKEKRFVFALVVPSVLLFYLGVCFAYWVAFPLMFAFFARVVPQSVQLLPDINQYLEFTLSLFLAFGLVFEVPMITVLLVISGALTRQQLIAMRPTFIVIAFIVGMLLTPPDVLSQIMLAGPMCLLYELGIFLCRFCENSHKIADESA